MSEPIVEARAITNRLNGSVIHRDLSMTVERGEILAIVGGSGAGKTVLLRTLALLHQPSAGTVRLFGNEARALRGAALKRLRRRLGVMFQHGALFSSLTVLENVQVPIREQTGFPRGEVLDELALLKLGMAGLPPDAAFKYPSELSGGMIKRAALARALALDPELLFLDEPTSGLDPVSAGRFDEMIEHLTGLLNLTVVMVTHDTQLLRRVTDRVAFLGEQRILATGPVDEVARFDHPELQAYFQGPRGG